MSEEEEEAHEITQIPAISKIKGVKIRRRVDPAVTPDWTTYQCVRKVKRSIKGTRLLFTLQIKGKALYSTKMKGKRPNDPLPIAKGGEMHYSSEEFAAFLLSGNDHTSFSLRAQTKFGKELLSIQMKLTNGEKDLPKTTNVTFFLKDSLIPTKLINRQPTFNDDGYFELNFNNKPTISSIKNCILINEENQCEFVYVRKVSKNVVEVDIVNVMSPLAAFSIALSLFESKY